MPDCPLEGVLLCHCALRAQGPSNDWGQGIWSVKFGVENVKKRLPIVVHMLHRSALAVKSH